MRTHTAEFKRGTVAAVAAKCGVSRETVRLYLAGVERNYGYLTVRAIEAALEALKKPASRKAGRKGAGK